MNRLFVDPRCVLLAFLTSCTLISVANHPRLVNHGTQTVGACRGALRPTHETSAGLHGILIESIYLLEFINSIKQSCAITWWWLQHDSDRRCRMFLNIKRKFVSVNISDYNLHDLALFSSVHTLYQSICYYFSTELDVCECWYVIVWKR